ncbi:MAG: hypothetical protein DHS20C09_12000 [marine bacterium B5-7]|nr:MAG: hypothetical protein DHS20C09_12000 [marine bacterium B5-7]
MKGMAYFLFVVVGVILGTVWWIVGGIYQIEFNSNGPVLLATFVVMTYSGISVLLIVVDAYAKYGWYAIFGMIFLGWTGPLLILGYLAHVYLEANAERNEETRT